MRIALSGLEYRNVLPISTKIEARSSVGAYLSFDYNVSSGDWLLPRPFKDVRNKQKENAMNRKRLIWLQLFALGRR